MIASRLASYFFRAFATAFCRHAIRVDARASTMAAAPQNAAARYVLPQLGMRRRTASTPNADFSPPQQKHVARADAIFRRRRQQRQMHKRAYADGAPRFWRALRHAARRYASAAAR